jgi:hypothetical protein
MSERSMVIDWMDWPNTVLPMVNTVNRDMGIILSSNTSKVYVKNLFDLKDGAIMPQLEDVKVYEYTDVDAMLKEWRVD